jgi:hypothetical protein
MRGLLGDLGHSGAPAYEADNDLASANTFRTRFLISDIRLERLTWPSHLS